jgi:alkanesulfonate monooxygenase SsuD/methylene tetrahydromethanopterin reductase-like flavin-dependent oxidoreductase (luciferase family)
MNAIWNVFEEEAVMQMLAYSFIGGPDKIKAKMQAFVAENQIDEVMVTAHIYNHDEKLKSYRIFAELLKEPVQASY